MTPADLVDDGLAGVPTMHAIELIRTDAPVRYGLQLDRARLSSVTLPEGAIVDGEPDAEQPVTVTAGGVTLTLDHAAPQRADLVPRADGARTYSLYDEHAVVAAG